MLFHQKTLVLLAFEVFRVDTAANYNLVAIVDLLATIMKGIDERKHVHEQVFFGMIGLDVNHCCARKRIDV